MFSLLFHSDVFVPEGIQDEVKRIQRKMTSYRLSKHFKEHLDNQATEDRSHTYFRNAVMNSLNQMTSNSRVLREAFEVELSKDYHFFGKSGWIVTKYCIRIPYDSQTDLVVVIRPQWDANKLDYDASNNLVATAWINHKRDNHSTLRAGAYCTKAEWYNSK